MKSLFLRFLDHSRLYEWWRYPVHNPVLPNVASDDLVNADLTRPFEDYLIAASHNSYLVGKSQLWSRSSVGQYRKLIRELGCLCIEIDVHNGWFGGDPIVTHGHTFCSSVKFLDVIREIKACLLEQPDLPPLIVSLEIRTDPKRTATMCDMLRRELGPLLHDYTEPLTPHQLRGKVLIQNAVGVAIPVACLPTHNINERFLTPDNYKYYSASLTRVYPAATRLWSSNPTHVVRNRFSMVALNYQTDETACASLRGYVLKESLTLRWGPLMTS